MLQMLIRVINIISITLLPPQMMVVTLLRVDEPALSVVPSSI